MHDETTNGRIGNQAFEDAQGNTFFLKKNVGDSRTNGVELYAEYTPLQEALECI